MEKTWLPSSALGSKTSPTQKVVATMFVCQGYLPCARCSGSEGVQAVETMASSRTVATIPLSGGCARSLGLSFLIPRINDSAVLRMLLLKSVAATASRDGQRRGRPRIRGFPPDTRPPGP